MLCTSSHNKSVLNKFFSMDLPQALAVKENTNETDA